MLTIAETHFVDNMTSYLSNFSSSSDQYHVVALGEFHKAQ